MIVCDTNVLIAAFVFPGGFPDKILRAILASRFQHATSPDILTEFRCIVGKKFYLKKDEIEEIVSVITTHSTMVYPTERLSVVEKDETDNRILECAIEARAQWLITGDRRHLLPLKGYKDVKIVSPRDFALIQGLT